jgi:hypothetical protein
MVRLLLKLGADPNSSGPKNSFGCAATALDACIFGLGMLPPDVGKYATATNRLEYFEHMFKCIMYLIAAGANPEKEKRV